MTSAHDAPAGAFDEGGQNVDGFARGRALFLQIAESVEDSIVDGSLAEESRAPSTNELAAFYRINPATAAKGIAMLVDKGVLTKRRGVGMFVATGARDLLRRERQTAFADRYLDPLLIEAARLGLDPQVQLLWGPPDTHAAAQALEIAARADAIIAVMGLSPRFEGEEMPVHIEGFTGGDRTDIALPAAQQRLLEQLHALGKPVVLVLLNGSAVAVRWAASEIPAIVEAWYPGEAGGEALADVLFGDYCPGGRLPVTWYASVDDLPPFDDYRMEGRTYRFFRGQPLFPFGHGLSYTTFELGNLRPERSQAQIGDEVSLSLDVTNTGTCAGDEVVQLYVRHPDAVVPRPMLELKGFRRIHLRPGERRTVTFSLHTHQLGYYDVTMRYAVHPGMVELLIGNSSRNLPLRAQLEIVGRRTEVDKVFFSKTNER